MEMTDLQYISVDLHVTVLGLYFHTIQVLCRVTELLVFRMLNSLHIIFISSPL